MAALIPAGAVMAGLQLPIQAQSPRFVQEWELTAGPEDLAEIAVAADESGIGYVAVCDHVAVPVDAGIGATWYEPFATLAWLGALTRRVMLLTHVLVVPYRHPLVAAKAAATIDRLTGGRFVLGVGAGHVEDEFSALGADFPGRGRAVEDAVGVLRQAFTGSLDGLSVEPAPEREGGPPIWIGGSSPAAVRRSARVGDGWLPQGPPERGTRWAIAEIRRRREEAGLVPGGFPGGGFDMGVNCEPVYLGTPSFEVTPWTLTGSPPQVAEGLGRYVSLGINQLQVRFVARSTEEYVEQLRSFGEEVVPLLPAAGAVDR